MKAFCIKHFGSPLNAEIPRATIEFVRRCRNTVLTSEYSVGKRSKGAKKRGGTMRNTFPNRRRRHGLQGRPPIMPELGHLLFQWFVDIRSSVKRRLKRRIVLAAARGLIQDIQASAVRSGLPP